MRWIVRVHAIRPPAWGRAMWRWLHALAADDGRRLFAADVHAVLRAIPCRKCRSHAGRHVRAHSPPERAGASAVAWVADFHGAVNLRLGKRPPEAPRRLWTRPAAARALARALVAARPRRTSSTDAQGQVRLTERGALARSRAIGNALRVLAPRAPAPKRATPVRRRVLRK